MIYKKTLPWKNLLDIPQGLIDSDKDGVFENLKLPWEGVQNKPFMNPLPTRVVNVTPDNFLEELEKARSGFQNIYYLEPGEYTISKNITLPFCSYVHIVGLSEDVIIKPSLYTYASYSTSYKIFMPLGTLTVANVTIDISLTCDNCDAHAGIFAFSRVDPWTSSKVALIGQGQLFFFNVVLNLNSEVVYPVVVRDYGTLFLMMRAVTINVGDNINGFVVDANYSRLLEYDFTTTINLGSNATFSITRPDTVGSWVVKG